MPDDIGAFFMLDLTSFDAALKEYYTDDAVEDMVYKNNPLFALMPKNEKFFGEYKVIPIIYGNPQGRSATFSRAQTRGASTSSYLKKFAVTRVKDYSIATMDNETMLASANDRGAFMSAATLEIDGCINALTRSLATDMYRAGYGARGSIATSSFATTTLTLNNLPDIVNFEVGMELMLATTEAASALKALGSSGNGLIVTGVNRIAGTLTFAYNVNDATNGIPTIAQNDVLFVRGDREDSATPARTKIAGLQAWVPDSAPASTSFFGMDRTSDVTRLGGLRYDASALPIEEGLIEAASLVAREGGMIDHFFMAFDKYSALEKSLGSKVQYVDLAANARIAFRGIRVNGPNGEIRVVPDQNCPTARCFGLQLNTWELASIGKAVRVIDTDSLEMLRLNTSDGVEVRYGFYGNVCCNAPGKNINVQLA